MKADPHQPTPFLELRLDLGECPRWHPLEKHLYGVDIEAGVFFDHNPLTVITRLFTLGIPLGCLAFCQEGGLVLGTGRGFARWSLQGGLQELPGLTLPPGIRFNDGAVDQAGRFWAGTKAPSGQAALYRLNPDGSIRLMDAGFTICNGLGWSPDNSTMYFTDSASQTIYAYDFSLERGELGSRRVFASFQEPGVEPDGLVVDNYGGVWSALWNGWKIVHLNPEGIIDLEITLPVARVTACTFMGNDRHTLCITTAKNGLTNDERVNQPMAGRLFTARVDVAGLPEPFFAG